MAKQFDEAITSVRTNGAVPVHQCCFGYGFINKGGVAVTVNQTLLLPAPAPGLSGESYFYIDDEKALYSQKQFLVTFAAGANPYVEIHQYHIVS
jgi:hypothetical protein